MSQLPNGWRWSTVGEVGSVDLGRQRHPDWHHGPEMRPYLRVANVFEDRIDATDIKEMDFLGVFERYKLHPGDVLLNEGQTPELLGRPAIYRGNPPDVAFTNTLLRFRAGPEVLPEWALTVFRRHMHIGRFAKESRITTNIAHLSARRFKTVEFPVPPLDEQRRIVYILEDHLSRLDAADASLRAVLRRNRIARQAIIDRAASGLLDGGVADASGLGAEWTWAAPSEVAAQGSSSIVIGPFGSNLKTSDYTKDGVPLVFVRNVRQSYFGPRERRYVSVEKAGELSPHHVISGDIVITKMGDPPGDAAVYDVPGAGIVTADVIRLRPRDDQSADYLALAINSSLVARQIERITRGVAQKKVSLARFRSEIMIPVPVDSKLQGSTAGRVRELTWAFERVENDVNESVTKSAALRRALLAAAFAGQLTGRIGDMDLAEEVAGV